MQKSIVMVGITCLWLATGCEKDPVDLTPPDILPPSLKLVGVASVNPEVASSVEKAELFAELRLNSLIALADGEVGALRFEETSGKWKTDIQKNTKISGAVPRAPVIKTNWLFLETEWIRPTNQPQAGSNIYTNGKRFVIEIQDVKDDLARRLREKAVKFVEAHAKTNNLKVLNWRQALMKADCVVTAGTPQFSGKLEIVLQE